MPKQSCISRLFVHTFRKYFERILLNGLGENSNPTSDNSDASVINCIAIRSEIIVAVKNSGNTRAQSNVEVRTVCSDPVIQKVSIFVKNALDSINPTTKLKKKKKKTRA